MPKRDGAKTGGESSSQRVPYLVRLPEHVHHALNAASGSTGLSMNAVVTRAVTLYVTSPAYRDDVDQARARQDEAIRKLAGG